jgi:hypothetical protein
LIKESYGVQHVIETSFTAFPFRFFFTENMEALSNKHGERFHLSISHMEKRYSGKWSPNMLVDYCWSLIRETPTGEYEAKEDEVRLL